MAEVKRIALEKRVEALETKVAELDSRTAGSRVYAGDPMKKGPWTFDVLRKLVYEVRGKPNWVFEIKEEEDTLRLVITIDTVSTYPPHQPFRVSHYHPVPHTTYTEAQWKEWIYDQCIRSAQHELGEWLRWGDEHPFAPLHGPGEDPYTVHKPRPPEDFRKDQRGNLRD